MSAFDLYIARHGEARYEAEGRHPREAERHLSPRGRRHAAAVARALAAQAPFDALYSSPMGRAYQTATAVSSTIAMPIEVVPELAEVTPLDGPLAREYRRFVAEWSVRGFRRATWRAFPIGRRIARESRIIAGALAGILERHGIVRHGACYRRRGRALHRRVAVIAHSGVMQIMLAELLDLPVIQSFHIFADELGWLSLVRLVPTGGMLMPVLKSFGEPRP